MARSLDFARLQQALLRGQVDPIYLFEGEEAFFHEEGIRLLTHALFPEGASSVDREALWGADFSLDEVLDLAETYPMGAASRLIVIRGAEALRSADSDRLRRYLERPNPKSCVVFSDTAFDRRRALYKALVAGATRITCGRLDESEAAAWVRGRLRERGFGIGADLADAIAAGSAAQGLSRLDAELQKLMDAIGSPRPVAPGDLALLADAPRVADAFRLAARIVRGERGEAVLALRALLQSGEDPIRLLGGLSWYFRNALKARVASTRRLPPREMAALYGLDPGRVDRFQREIGPGPSGPLQDALAECLRADRELKGAGARDPAQALERLAHRVGRPRGETA